MNRAHLPYLFLMLALMSNLIASAQTYREEGYVYLYDADHRVVVRDMVECNIDYQDLWNGDMVRIINGKVYIYRANQRITYGDEIWLEHTGNYTVERGGYHYLMDENGNSTGLYGDVIDILWNGTARVKRGDYYYLYTTDNYRLGGIYSDEKIQVYYNGYYCYHVGGFYYIADPDGNRINNSWSDIEPVLMNSGNWRCERGNLTVIIDRSGSRVN